MITEKCGGLLVIRPRYWYEKENHKPENLPVGKPGQWLAGIKDEQWYAGIQELLGPSWV